LFIYNTKKIGENNEITLVVGSEPIYLAIPRCKDTFANVSTF